MSPHCVKRMNRPPLNWRLTSTCAEQVMMIAVTTGQEKAVTCENTVAMLFRGKVLLIPKRTLLTSVLTVS